MNILGKIGESNAPKGQMDWNGFLKTIRGGLVTAAAAVVSFLIVELPKIDLAPGSQLDELVLMGLLIPLLGSLGELLRRMLVDYSTPPA